MSRTFREGGNMSVLIKGMEMPKDGAYWCEIGVAGEIATITIHGKDRKAFPLIQIPTDAVPVVRCKDCRFNPKVSFVGCPMSGLDKRKDWDFCSYGDEVTE